MSLAAGTMLGPYQIPGLLGAGGMGEVYKARDTRLDRTVAIKILPTEFSSDPHRRARFEREAKTIAGLAHPHICTLYDVGEQPARDPGELSLFLVMEYLEGETLAQRLERGALPLDQVLRHGVEIASALAVAHRARIVHRDLKPANVMLTKSGVKLLDFGLAKLRADGDAGLVSEPTMLDRPLTGEGTLLGTLPYMAPEQVEGKEADVRSDIWALGTVLYEMATGQRAFHGKSQASLIGAILKDEVPGMTTIQPLVPPALDRVVKACLEKDPDDLFQLEARHVRGLVPQTDRPPGCRGAGSRVARPQDPDGLVRRWATCHVQQLRRSAIWLGSLGAVDERSKALPVSSDAV